MEEISKFFLDFFRTKDGKKSYQGLVILIIILCLVNYLFGFSDQYKFEKKIENLKSIENLLQDKSLDKNVAIYLIQKKNNIITEIKFNENELYLVPKKEIRNFLDFRKFPILHYISSSWLFILLTFYFPFALIKRNTISTGTFFTSRLLTISIMSITTYILSILYSSILELIPIFSYKFLWINYLLNIFSIVFVISFLFFTYSLLNYGVKYSEISEKKTLNKKAKDEIFDPFNYSALGKVIGEKNPLLWAGEIIRYNFKENRKISNILLTVFILFWIVFVLFSIFYTLYNIFINKNCR